MRYLKFQQEEGLMSDKVQQELLGIIDKAIIP